MLATRLLQAASSGSFIFNTYSIDGDASSTGGAVITDDPVFNLTNNFSASLWCKNDSSNLSANEFLFSKFGGAGAEEWRIQYQAAEKVRIVWSEDGTANITDTQDGVISNVDQWHHVGFTFASGTVIIYVDGSLVASTQSGSGTTIHNSTADVELMANAFNNSNKWNGRTDEFALWDVVLNSADWTAIYNSGVPRDLTLAASYDTDRTGNLVGYWRCGDNNGGVGSTISDQSGNGNDASMEAGCTFVVDTP